MRRALELARLGAGQVAPNPMVGAVLVQGERVLAEGWHRSIGGPHAEVECLNGFGEGSIPADATLFVNLEPCSHQGRTPPCVDLLIRRELKHLVVAHSDPNPAVHGRGFARAREAGMEVITGVCEAEARWLNRRFLTFHEERRPYIVLKWARSGDGFMDDRGRSARISSAETDVLVHRWRSEEPAILVGSRTVINDDPQLTVRHVAGRQPLRVVIDRGARTPAKARAFDGSAPTLLLTDRERLEVAAEQLVIAVGSDPIDALLVELQRRTITSVLVEGGAELLGHFLARGLWDEARVITGAAAFAAGTKAPELTVSAARSIVSGPDRIALFVNESAPDPAWTW